MAKRTSVGPVTTSATGRLRVLETTDLHMQLLDYDYFADRPDHSIGLIGLADQIDALRGDARIATVLCDNGDLIQGNPLADYLAQHLATEETHPMIGALNALQYDAMTLGNHEFDYGLKTLRDIMAGANFPIVSANISVADMPKLATPFVILKREIACDDGQLRTLNIGITGFAPPQIADWDYQPDQAKVAVDDIVVAAERVVPKMRAAGADLVIALCHSGIGAADHSARMENAAIPLAAVDGIDVVLTGHTHEAFPEPHIQNTVAADYTRSTLHNKPAVMAGFCGKSLGVVDLWLRWDQGHWEITDHHVQLQTVDRATGPESPLRKHLRSLVAAPHVAVIAQMQEPIAQTTIPICSYFATIQPDVSQQLLARATRQAVQAALSATNYHALPVLAAKSSFRFGGRSGLGHYIDIPAGPIRLRDAAAIFPFADKLCAVRRTGAQIKLWLERSASHYNQMQPGLHDQALIAPLSAGYNCDTIYGLTYQVDLTQPARFHTQGHQIDPGAARITNLKYDGAFVRDEDVFVVATNSFRAKGGGGFPHVAPADILNTSRRTIREFLIGYLKELRIVTIPAQRSWSFADIPQTSAIFTSAPKAKDHLEEPISYIGPGADGFDRYRITF